MQSDDRSHPFQKTKYAEALITDIYLISVSHNISLSFINEFNVQQQNCKMDSNSFTVYTVKFPKSDHSPKGTSP